MNKWRRYVYLVVDNFKHGTYPLRRIEASRLFHPRNQAKVATTPPDHERLLPRPYIGFTPSRTTYEKGNLEFFGLFGRGQKKRSLLAAVDYHGVSYTYDVEDCSIHDIVPPSAPKFSHPVSLAVGDALYVMDRELVPRRRSFEALTFDPPKAVRGKADWDWHLLPPPPFVLEPGFKNTFVGGYTVVGGSNIWISTPGVGVYSFDTLNGSWGKVGDWELPFHGRAYFFPEYGVWLGFSAQDELLCCLSDLGDSMERTPALDMVWDDLNPQIRAILRKSYLVHLGSGMFCVARFFESVENELTEIGCIPQIERFAVLTGVVLKPNGDTRGLEMTPHRSLLYRFQGMTDGWVF